MSTNFKAHAAVLTANLIYGANYLIAKEVMPEYLEPFAFIALRVSVAAVIFLALAYFLVKEKKVERKDKRMLLICAVFGVATNQLLFFKGLSITTPINAALMMTTNPVLVLLLAAVILKEKISLSKISGIVLGISGALTLILFGREFHYKDSTLLGDAMVFLNSLAFGLYLVLVKPLVQKYHPLTVMKWVYMFGIFMVWPFGFNEVSQTNFSTFPPEIWLGIAYVIIAVTVIAYTLNIFGLLKLSPSTVSTYIYSQPAFATLFSIIFGKDHPNLLHLLAAVLIFSGVYLVSRPSNAR
ncbi:MAG: DMT family transporter [Bacteroidia bacterium]|nr:DMT family transporter [Bacteroidia bacterium]